MPNDKKAQDAFEDLKIKLNQELLRIGDFNWLEINKALAQLPPDKRFSFLTTSPYFKMMQEGLSDRKRSGWKPLDLYNDSFYPILSSFSDPEQIKLIARFRDIFPDKAASELSWRIKALTTAPTNDPEAYQLILDQVDIDFKKALQSDKLNLDNVDQLAHQYRYLDAKALGIRERVFDKITHGISGASLWEVPILNDQQRSELFTHICRSANTNSSIIFVFLAISKNYLPSNYFPTFIDQLATLRHLSELTLTGFNDDDYKKISAGIGQKSSVKELTIHTTIHLKDLLLNNFPNAEELRVSGLNDAMCKILLEEVVEKHNHLSTLHLQYADEEKGMKKNAKYQLIQLVLRDNKLLKPKVIELLQGSLPSKISDEFKAGAPDEKGSPTVSAPSDTLKLLKQSFSNEEKELGMEFLVLDDAEKPTRATFPFPKLTHVILRYNRNRLLGDFYTSILIREKTKAIKSLAEFKEPLSAEDKEYYEGLINNAADFKQLEKLEEDAKRLSLYKLKCLDTLGFAVIHSILFCDYLFFKNLISQAKNIEALEGIARNIRAMQDNEATCREQNLIPDISSEDIGKAIAHFDKQKWLFTSSPSYFKLLGHLADQKAFGSADSKEILVAVSQYIFIVDSSNKNRFNPVKAPDTKNAKEPMYEMNRILSQLEPVRAILEVAAKYNLHINIDKDFISRVFIYRGYIPEFIKQIDALAATQTLTQDSFMSALQTMHIDNHLKAVAIAARAAPTTDAKAEAAPAPSPKG